MVPCEAGAVGCAVVCLVVESVCYSLLMCRRTKGKTSMRNRSRTLICGNRASVLRCDDAESLDGPAGEALCLAALPVPHHCGGKVTAQQSQWAPLRRNK